MDTYRGEKEYTAQRPARIHACISHTFAYNDTRLAAQKKYETGNFTAELKNHPFGIQRSIFDIFIVF